MSYDENTLSRFDSYSDGSMSETEKANFRRELNEDDKLASAYQDYLALREGISEFGYKTFSEKMKEWESEIGNENEAKVIPVRSKWYMMAAAIALLILAMIGVRQFSNETTDEEIIASYYAPYPDVITDRGNGEQLLNEGLYLYESGEYTGAITSLRKYITEHNQKKEVLFYLGQAYLANGQAGEALEIFNTLSEEENFKLSEANEWFRAIACFKLDNKETAKEILQQIRRNTDHAYRERSENLLEELN